MDGRFVLRTVPAGTHSVVVEMLGYANKTVTGVVVGTDSVTTLDISMEPAALRLGRARGRGHRRNRIHRGLAHRTPVRGLPGGRHRRGSDLKVAGRGCRRGPPGGFRDCRWWTGGSPYVRGLGER